MTTGPSAPDSFPLLEDLATPPASGVPRADASVRPVVAHLAGLDGLRAIAVMSVVFYHLNLSGFFAGGFLGVDIFFCLSGLLMSNLLFVKRVPLTNFYKRRISRILPAFVLFQLNVPSLL